LSEVEVSIRELRSRDGGRGALVIPGLLLASCAAPGPAPTPADFPRHNAAPPVEIHWRLDGEPGRVRADGLVERRNHLIGSAWLQVVGLDSAGAIVSFTTPTRIHWRSESDLESFAIPIRPRGGEARYEVRLYSFEYPEENTP
jgi:hypothetical protein